MACVCVLLFCVVAFMWLDKGLCLPIASGEEGHRINILMSQGDVSMKTLTAFLTSMDFVLPQGEKVQLETAKSGLIPCEVSDAAAHNVSSDAAAAHNSVSLFKTPSD